MIQVTLGDGRAAAVARALIAPVAESALGSTLLAVDPALRDATGRVALTCAPAHWQAICTFLATGTAVARPDAQLVAQARAYGLGAMVERLEAGRPGVAFERHDTDGGFRARFTFCDVGAALAAGRGLSLAVADEGNRLWRVTAGENELQVTCDRADDRADAAPYQAFAGGLAIGLRLASRPVSGQRMVDFEEPVAVAVPWVRMGYSLDELLSDQIALCPGNLVVEVETKPKAKAQ